MVRKTFQELQSKIKAAAFSLTTEVDEYLFCFSFHSVDIEFLASCRTHRTGERVIYAVHISTHIQTLVYSCVQAYTHTKKYDVLCLQSLQSLIRNFSLQVFFPGVQLVGFLLRWLETNMNCLLKSEIHNWFEKNVTYDLFKDEVFAQPEAPPPPEVGAQTCRGCIFLNQFGIEGLLVDLIYAGRAVRRRFDYFPPSLHYFRRTLQLCFVVKLQKCFVDCENSPRVNSEFFWTHPLKYRQRCMWLWGRHGVKQQESDTRRLQKISSWF